MLSSVSFALLQYSVHNTSGCILSVGNNSLSWQLFGTVIACNQLISDMEGGNTLCVTQPCALIRLPIKQRCRAYHEM